MSAFIVLESFTEANKAKNYLKGLKINCEVEKTTISGGCAYGIRVHDNPDRICRQLQMNGINCKKIIYEDRRR